MFGGALNELFAPGRRHTEEERRRQELTLEEAGDADPGRGPIDLGSGVVLIRVPAARDEARSAEGEPEDGDKNAEGAEHTKAAEDGKNAGDGKNAEAARAAEGAE
ncbi:DUF6191 domain-containing protein [Streptomyces wuyuanensis]|uniref:Uncharacterized protein n=1 Tax=Streptomyces wuyuanensis TaxID=1196353 RepID=A0A1G9PEG1_9ACTN|nr:DUF6191 domain-containing protein [Streptomyces wuyuanensis]SDL96861.1 hypothetical protein SAMN05444921_102442 [Streptomyces wuyuanensis]